MKTLSATLLAEQKKPIRQPALEVVFRTCGHPSPYSAGAYHFGFFGWEKLYSASTPTPTNHGLAIPSDGSLNRIYVDDSFYIWQQRVTSPGAGSNYADGWGYLTSEIQKFFGQDYVTPAGYASANYICIDKFTCTVTGNVSQIRVYCGAVGNVKAALYADSSGSPGALLAANNTGIVTAAGWNTITLPATAVVSGTNYWIAMNSDTPVVAYASVTGGVSWYKAGTYANDFPDPAGSGWNVNTNIHVFTQAWGSPPTITGAKPNAAIAGGPSSQNMYVFYNSGSDIYYKKSSDGGATWGAGAVVCSGYTPILMAAMMLAADIADVLFVYVDGSGNHVLTLIGGSSGGWTGLITKTLTGDFVVSAAIHYDGDFNIILQLTTGKLCRVVYGNGYRQAVGTWSDLEYIGLSGAVSETVETLTQQQFQAQQQSFTPEYVAWATGNENYYATSQPILRRTQPDRRSQYQRNNFGIQPIEEYPFGIDHMTLGWSAVSTVMGVQATATENVDIAYPFICKPSGQPAIMSFKKPGERWYYRLKPGTDFYDSKWSLAIRQALDAPYGMALACDSTHIWATAPNEVWRCTIPGIIPTQSMGSEPYARLLAVQQSEIITIKENIRPLARSELIIEVDNSTGRYQSLPTNTILRGSKVELNYGYFTTTSELTGGNDYFLESWTYCHKDGRSTIIFYCIDAWGLLERFTMPCPVEINMAANTYTVYAAIALLCALVGVTLSYKSRSSAITAVYPRFTIRAGQSLASVIRQLLTYVPDVIFFSGFTGYIVYPQAADSSVYDYYFPNNQAATEQLHYLQEGRYQLKGKELNHVIVIGKDSDDEIVTGDEQDVSDIGNVGERLDFFYKPQLGSSSDADTAAAAAMAAERLANQYGFIIAPPNCGIEPFDVVTIHDSAGWQTDAKYRVSGINTLFSAPQGEYQQRLTLCGV